MANFDVKFGWDPCIDGSHKGTEVLPRLKLINLRSKKKNIPPQEKQHFMKKSRH